MCGNQVFFLFWQIIQDLKKNFLKSRTPFFRHWWVEKMCKISLKNIRLYGSWSSSKFSFFQTKSQPIKPNLILTRRAILNKGQVKKFLIRSTWRYVKNYISNCSRSLEFDKKGSVENFVKLAGKHVYRGFF